MHAVLETNKGTIAFRFHKNKAPVTVEHFVRLARSGTYDGTKWHRVIPNFVIQGGCPKGDGSGGNMGLKIEPCERKHIRGAVALARARSPNSGGSQFYICRSTLPHLDGYDTVFGEVTAGLDVVDKIEKGDAIVRIAVVDE